MCTTSLPPDEGLPAMKHLATRKLLALSTLLGLVGAANVAHAAFAVDSASGKPAQLLAQAAPPAPTASAPAADAQPDNRETPARPAARRRGVGVVISMNTA